MDTSSFLGVIWEVWVAILGRSGHSLVVGTLEFFGQEESVFVARDDVDGRGDTSTFLVVGRTVFVFLTQGIVRETAPDQCDDHTVLLCHTERKREARL